MSNKKFGPALPPNLQIKNDIKKDDIKKDLIKGPTMPKEIDLSR